MNGRRHRYRQPPVFPLVVRSAHRAEPEVGRPSPRATPYEDTFHQDGAARCKGPCTTRLAAWFNVGQWLSFPRG